MFLRSALLVISFALISHARVDQRFWIPVHHGTHAVDLRSFSLARFRGVDDYGALAYIISRDGVESFGHTYINGDGELCARFAGSHGESIFECGGFRVLGNGSFRLVAPDDRYNENDLVEFLYKRAALIDAGPLGTFFGFVDFKRNEAWGIDRDGRPYKLNGRDAIVRYCRFIVLNDY